AELLKQLGRNRRQSRRLGFRFARHKFSLGACYALNTKFLTGPVRALNCDPEHFDLNQYRPASRTLQ
ncbi:hypothetical protein KDW67_34815, partial [Burkholderia cenocepacia]|uniref:hypothetical protein n=1 Tax=Burkholderia TaxID=32008 RepID=UPI001B96D10C